MRWNGVRADTALSHRVTVSRLPRLDAVRMSADIRRDDSPGRAELAPMFFLTMWVVSNGIWYLGELSSPFGVWSAPRLTWSWFLIWMVSVSRDQECCSTSRAQETWAYNGARTRLSQCIREPETGNAGRLRCSLALWSESPPLTRKQQAPLLSLQRSAIAVA